MNYQNYNSRNDYRTEGYQNMNYPGFNKRGSRGQGKYRNVMI